MKDLFLSISALILEALSVVVLLKNILDGNIIKGLILLFVGLILVGLCLSQMSSETWRAANELDKQKKQKKLHGGYTCPNCGFKSGHEISYGEKRASIRRRGMASNKIGKSYKCENCKYMW